MAQKIFYNGKIHSFNKACPQPEAIAIRDGKILALGKLIALKALSHNDTEWINLKGKTVLPAFFDQEGNAIAPAAASSFEEALRAYTVINTTVSRVLDKTGSFAVGKDADMIVLEKSTFLVAPEVLKNWKLTQVYRKGKLDNV